MRRNKTLLTLLAALAFSCAGAFGQAPDYSAYILTPKAPDTPRINGPKVYGARPGADFLFRIPKKGFPLLNLPSDEAQTLIRALTHLPNRLFKGSDEVRRLFKKLFHQYDTLPKDSSERSLRLRSTVLALLLAVVDASRSSMRDRVEVRLQNLVDDMREHPEHEYPLDQTAERLGLSPSNLLVRFKRLTGLPPHAFLLAQRIAKAKEMLTASMPIATIAHKLGFATSQHLSNQFKASTGLSPSEWKKKC